jgi:hypothetical protein
MYFLSSRGICSPDSGMVYGGACKFAGWRSRVEIGASSVESNHGNLLMFDRKRFCAALHKMAKESLLSRDPIPICRLNKEWQTNG